MKFVSQTIFLLLLRAGHIESLVCPENMEKIDKIGDHLCYGMIPTANGTMSFDDAGPSCEKSFTEGVKVVQPHTREQLQGSTVRFLNAQSTNSFEVFFKRN